MILLSCGFVKAQTIYAPGGTLGTSSNSSVGVGTSSPEKFLHVHGDDLKLSRSAGSWGPNLFLDGTKVGSGGVVWGIGTTTAADTAGAGKLVFHSAGSVRMAVASSGYVGIGTTSPSSMLDIWNYYSSDTDSLRFSYNDGTAYWMGIRPYVVGAGNVGYKFRTNNGASTVDAIAITGDGKVGVGTTSPQQRLDVAGSVRSYGLQLFGSGQLQAQWLNTADPLDEKITEFIQQNGYFIGRFVNDAYSLADNWLQVRRNSSTYSVQSVSFPSGNVGIGTTNPTHKLAVNGTIKAKEVVVELSGWADHVFAEDYQLAPLSDVEAHIRERGHLPGLPSADEVAEVGVNVGEMQRLLLQKIEELMLHQIFQGKMLKTQADEIAELRRENADLRRSLSTVSSRH